MYAMSTQLFHIAQQRMHVSLPALLVSINLTLDEGLPGGSIHLIFFNFEIN